MPNKKSQENKSRRSRLSPLDSVRFGLIVGAYFWVAGAPFGFLHPDERNWVFSWRLPPLWRLFLLVALSVAAVFCFKLAFLLYLHAKTGERGSEVTDSFRRILSPIYFLLISPLQLVPAVMAALPVLPLVNKLILPLAVFSSVLFLFAIETGVLSSQLFRKLDRAIPSHKWRWSLVLFLVSLTIYGMFMRRCNRAFGYTGGDEAHYLIQARSLAEDFDRDLINQMPDYRRDRDYFSDKHFSPKSAPGKAYSYHSIGLPLLLAPGWAVDNIKGALGVLLILSSLFAVTFFWVAFSHRPRSEFAIGAWGIFCFTTPIISYACRAYPELPSALIILFVVWKMEKPKGLRAGHWLLLGCLTGFLPWLHIPRLALPTLLLSLWGAAWLLLRKKFKGLACFLPPLFVSLVLLIVLNQHWYGHSWGQPPGATGFEKLDPQAWTGGYYHRPRDLFSCLPGLIGAIMDRYRGLLSCSPVYLVPLACLVLGLFSKKLKFWRHLWLWVLLIVYIPALSRRGWYGGACFPSRFLISVLPLLIYPLAGVLSERKDRLLRAFLAVLATFSIWITLSMLVNTQHFYRAVETARWYFPATQLIALFYPYAGTGDPLHYPEDPWAIALFILWIAAALSLIQWAKKKQLTWHSAFNTTIAAVLALPLLTTAIRRTLDWQPYQFSFSGPPEHYSTLTSLNTSSRAKLRIALWGRVSPQTVRQTLTFQLPAIEQKQTTGETGKDESLDRKFLLYDPRRHQPGYLCYSHPLRSLEGRYLARGHYVARFWLSVDRWNAEDTIILDIQDMRTGDIMAARRLTTANCPTGKDFVPIPVPFSLQRYSKLSLRTYVDTQTPVRILKFTVEPRCLPELVAAVRVDRSNSFQR